MNRAKNLLPSTISKKIWFFLISAYSFRFTLGYYPDFVFNSYYLLAFSIDLFINTLFTYISLYVVPGFLINRIKFRLPSIKFSFSKYFILPLRKDWLFVSFLGSVFVTVLIGTSLLYWWFLFFLIRIYFVNNKVDIKDSQEILFISYSTHDQLVVSKIKDRLKDHHNIDSWWQKDLLPTDDYEKKIIQKIEESTGSIIMYSDNYDESIPIQEWELDAISNRKIENESYFLTTCIVGKHNANKIPFADSLQIIPSRKDSLNRLDTEDFNKEVRLLAKGLSSFVNIKNGISREVYTDPRWFSFIGSFFMVGNFMYDSGLAYFFDPSIYQ
tara:strand:+ start:2469 stop:3449 length:981 start_codon:yes stop_codon:yes gene_type:complete